MSVSTVGLRRGANPYAGWLVRIRTSSVDNAMYGSAGNREKRVFAVLVGNLFLEYASEEEAYSDATTPRTQLEIIGVSASPGPGGSLSSRPESHRFTFVTRLGTVCQVSFTPGSKIERSFSVCPLSHLSCCPLDVHRCVQHPKLTREHGLRPLVLGWPSSSSPPLRGPKCPSPSRCPLRATPRLARRRGRPSASRKRATTASRVGEPWSPNSLAARSLSIYDENCFMIVHCMRRCVFRLTLFLAHV